MFSAMFKISISPSVKTCDQQLQSLWRWWRLRTPNVPYLENCSSDCSSPGLPSHNDWVRADDWRRKRNRIFRMRLLPNPVRRRHSRWIRVDRVLGWYQVVNYREAVTSVKLKVPVQACTASWQCGFGSGREQRALQVHAAKQDFPPGRRTYKYTVHSIPGSE